MPFISVVIPVYNVEQYLNRCVDSLISQRYEEYEIILVDDGSTDRSGELCDYIASRYDKVTAVHKNNGGLASARNFGLDYVRGKYVTFVDSDDWVTEEYFDFIDKHLKKNMVDVLKFGYQRIQAGRPCAITVPCFEAGYYDRTAIELNILPGTIGPARLFDYSKCALMSACVCAYSVEFLKRKAIHFRSEREILSEDHLFNFTVMLLADSIEISKKVLYMYDFREGSLTKRYIENMIERKQTLLQAYKAELIKHHMYEQYKYAYFAQCVDGYYACITNECSHWNSLKTGSDIERVSQILNIPECQIALKQCCNVDMGIKGKVIYWLMRSKQAFLICYLYKMIKQ